ncbi:putative trypsin-like serine protease precursor [Conidiobolus coronatus NRRL 28638]|uniref:Putative trypsin-like serine protease n=1 Tax=Conidiobolus coronatus (strain ATCC 28846 / CBS 209.66 / NRRL 28638) TaxID=796925 RepID=A0A137NQX0_CONC2|nr:putative trypsin-like serine protease precursor [Conidiobolus coronatus NRRL 28638]|eukprot:KXN65112.1 putative trypsin-like serine protease precursor [Conidiobolus coronatus NRRL 28638]
MSLNINNPANGVQAPPPRIVGGYEVSPAFKYPAMVSLFFNDGYSDRHYCGGTLYDGNTIITAAHCIDGMGGIEGQWTAKIHRHDLKKSDAEEGGKTFNVVNRILHPQYNSTSSVNDIAIWKIDAPKGRRTNVEIDDGTIGKETDTLLTTIGWGHTFFGGSGSNKLLEVKVPVFDIDTCAANHGDRIDKEKQVCAGYPEGGKDTCQSDSGGPLFKYENGKQILVGVTSFGIGCANPDIPGIYTRVSNYAQWIKKQL